jgi:hypothetical protein
MVVTFTFSGEGIFYQNEEIKDLLCFQILVKPRVP